MLLDNTSQKPAGTRSPWAGKKDSDTIRHLQRDFSKLSATKVDDLFFELGRENNPIQRTNN